MNKKPQSTERRIDMTNATAKAQKNSQETEEGMIIELASLAARTAELNLALDKNYGHNLDVDEFASDLSYALRKAKDWLKKEEPAAGVMSTSLIQAIAYAEAVLEEVEEEEEEEETGMEDFTEDSCFASVHIVAEGDNIVTLSLEAGDTPSSLL